MFDPLSNFKLNKIKSAIDALPTTLASSFNEVKNAIAGVDAKVEYNGEGIDALKENALLNAGSVVKSIQRGVVNLNNNTSGSKPPSSISISTINPDKAIAIVSIIGFLWPDLGFQISASYTLQANKLVISNLKENWWFAGISWQVIEFY